MLRKREQGDVCAQALLWLPRMVLVCATVAGSQAAAHLLLFPRYHLDNASVLARYPVEQVCSPTQSPRPPLQTVGKQMRSFLPNAFARKAPPAGLPIGSRK